MIFRPTTCKLGSPAFSTLRRRWATAWASDDIDDFPTTPSKPSIPRNKSEISPPTPSKPSRQEASNASGQGASMRSPVTFSNPSQHGFSEPCSTHATSPNFCRKVGVNQVPHLDPEKCQFPKKIYVRGGVPVHLYTDDIDDQTRAQLVNLARSPMPVGFVAAMPDVHLGKGATIGSVFASRDYICPNAVGVDIGCGMCAAPIEGPLMRQDLTEQTLRRIQRGLRNTIPTGFESHDVATGEMNRTLNGLVSKHSPTQWLRQSLSRRHAKQLGTLGGGNHFVELVYDESDRVWMLLHSGSRNIGNVTAQHYDEVASQKCGRDKESLAYLEIKSKEGQEYITDMTFCQAYALENRQFMLQSFARIMKKETRKDVLWDKSVNIHHNYCECEQCRYFDGSTNEWREEQLWVTRKGATSAKTGQLGIIPGSMGTGSYIVRGRGTADSWQSCSHGAGRSMSRKQAFSKISNRDFVKHMRDMGIVWDADYAERVKDEAPMAYKDLGEVMRNQAGLVEIVHRLQPLINMKGFA